MRTTVTIEDKIAKALKKTAQRSGRSFEEIVNKTLYAGLNTRQTNKKPKPYRLKPVSLGAVRPGIGLDRALQLAGDLENEELVHKRESCLD